MTLLQLVLSGTLVGGVYALLALGFVVIYKTAGIFNLAYGQFAMLGAYFAWTFMARTPDLSGTSIIPILKLPLPLALVLTAVTAIVFGLAVERLIFRRMIGRPGAATFILTLGLMEAITGLVVMVWGAQGKTYPNFMPQGVFHLGSIFLAKQYVVAFVAAVILMSGLIYFLQRTKLGLGMRAAFDHQIAARSMGVSVKRNAQIAWCLCTLLATASGILMASVMGVNLDLSALVMVALAVVLLGGLDSFLGCIIGGLMLAIGTNLVDFYVSPSLPGIAGVFPPILIFVILLLRPNGLFGTKTIERV